MNGILWSAACPTELTRVAASRHRTSSRKTNRTTSRRESLCDMRGSSLAGDSIAHCLEFNPQFAYSESGNVRVGIRLAHSRSKPPLKTVWPPNEVSGGQLFFPRAWFRSVTMNPPDWRDFLILSLKGKIF